MKLLTARMSVTRMVRGGSSERVRWASPCFPSACYPEVSQVVRWQN